MTSKKQDNSALISIVTVNHNGKEFLRSFFSSVFKQTYHNIEVIMVDNASSDDSINYVNTTFPSVKIVQLHENSGYATGSNKGLEQAKGDYVMLVNNDTILEKNTVEILYSTFSTIPNLGVVAPMVRLMKDKKTLDACGSFWTNTGFLYHYGIYKPAENPLYTKPMRVFSVKGVCMMFPKSLSDSIGLFDNSFWSYFEETDFCHRIWLAGYECWYYPTTSIQHHLGGTRLKKNEAFVQFHSFKNRIKSYLKNWSIMTLVPLLPIHLVFSLAYGIVLSRTNPGIFFSVIRAIFWNIFTLPITIAQRHTIQKLLRKQQDSQFLPLVTKNPPIEYYLKSNRLKQFQDI